jgi:Holliday junction resolvase RusA-like endonuclease
MEFIIAGNPKGKIRHRMNRGKAYDPSHKKKIATKFLIGAQMREKGFKRLSKEPLRLEVHAYCPIPKSLTKARKNDLKGQFVTTKPDLDNICKEWADILNGIAYDDDAHIAELYSKKTYCDKPRVEINIKPISELNKNIPPFGKGLC